MKRLIHLFDQIVGRWITSLPKSLYPVMLLFTWLGEPPFTVGFAAAVFGYGLALDKPLYETAGVIAFATIAAGSLLKLLLRRNRPISDYSKKMFFKTFSFPSGHAAGSMVSFLMAALVIGNRWPQLLLSASIIAVATILMVGISRVYLGAHYASDVIAGWLIGVVGIWFIFTNFYL